MNCVFLSLSICEFSWNDWSFVSLVNLLVKAGFIYFAAALGNRMKFEIDSWN